MVVPISLSEASRLVAVVAVAGFLLRNASAIDEGAWGIPPAPSASPLESGWIFLTDGWDDGRGVFPWIADGSFGDGISIHAPVQADAELFPKGFTGNKHLADWDYRDFRAYPDWRPYSGWQPRIEVGPAFPATGNGQFQFSVDYKW